MQNQLFHGDNLDILRIRFADSVVDLCYIDPPFYSRRDYYHADNEKVAVKRAFTDQWKWDDASAGTYRAILENVDGRQTPASIGLLRGLHEMLGESGLFAYVTSIAVRVAEIRRVLAPHGTFYLHVDPTAAHYLKLICDALFLPGGGEFRNEIIWNYESGGRGKRDFPWKHDTILRYTKSATWVFHAEAVSLPRAGVRRNHLKRNVDADGRGYSSIKSAGKTYRYYEDEGVLPSDVWTDLSHLHQRDPERLGYPTQKPEALLERLILASSNPGDLVLDAFCGSGTTLAVAQRLGRRWAGIDQSETAIAMTGRRMERQGEVALPSAATGLDIPPVAPATTANPTPG